MVFFDFLITLHAYGRKKRFLLRIIFKIYNLMWKIDIMQPDVKSGQGIEPRSANSRTYQLCYCSLQKYVQEFFFQEFKYESIILLQLL